MTAQILATLQERMDEVIAELENGHPGSARNRPRPEDIPLSQSQRNWLRMDPEGHCVCAHALTLRGPLDIRALKAALLQLMTRHEILRTRYVKRASQVVQVVDSEFSLPCFELDFTQTPEDARAAALEAAALAELAVPISLTCGPVWRILICRCAPEEHRLVVLVHHIAADAFTFRIIDRELRLLYAAIVNGRAATLPPALQYADFTLWEHDWFVGERLAAHEEFWQRSTTGAARLALTTDFPRSPPGYAERMYSSGIGPQLSERMEEYCARKQVSRLALLFGALKIVFSRWKQKPDVTVGCLTSGRMWPEILDTAGCFIRLMPIRTLIPPTDSLEDVIQAVHANLVRTYAFLGRTDFTGLRARNLLQFFINYLPLDNEAQPPPDDLIWPHTSTWELPIPPDQRVWYEMQLLFVERVDGIEIRCSYAADLYLASTIAALIEAQISTIEAVICAGEAQVHTIPGDPRSASPASACSSAGGKHP